MVVFITVLNGRGTYPKSERDVVLCTSMCIGFIMILVELAESVMIFSTSSIKISHGVFSKVVMFDGDVYEISIYELSVIPDFVI